MESFGEKLKRIRLDKGLGVRQLETMAGIPHGVVSRLERTSRAYPSIPAARKLAKVLGVTLDLLCGMYDRD